jgi:hypothetical protein
MTTALKAFAAAGALVLLAGCVTVPTGPGVMVLPGTGKSFDQFRADDMDCRQYANVQLGGTTAETAAADSAVKSAVIGTAIGAVAGAAVGGHNSAAAGAGMGLLTGSLIGASTSGMSQWEVQRRYDFAYQQCMYARGHKIPMSGYASGTRTAVRTYSSTPPAPPPPASAPAPSGSSTAPPPPPPGAPPPPPPGVR